MDQRYNTTLIICTRSNVDIQFITSTWDMVNYLVAYATKCEKDVCEAMKDVKDNIMLDENRTTWQKFKQLGNTFIDARSVSIQESIYRTLPLTMSVFHPKVIFIPSDMPHQRHGMLKTKKQMSDLEDESDDVFNKGYIDRYPHRPDDLRDVCYREFACNYQRLDQKVTVKNRDRIIEFKQPNLGNFIRRTSPQVARSHTPSRSKDPDGYYYSKICLYYPWTDESQILGQFATLEESFLDKFSIIKQNMLKFEAISSETLDSIIAEIQEEILANHCPQNSTQELDPRGMVSHPPNDLKVNDEDSNVQYTYKEPLITEQEYNSMVSSLNEQQRLIFDIIQNHASQLAAGNSPKQLIHFISGAGGVGKTFLINAIRHCINRTINTVPGTSSVLVAASTGVAAALIDGQTIHGLLQLDCQEGGFFNQKPINLSGMSTRDPAPSQPGPLSDKPLWRIISQPANLYKPVPLITRTEDIEVFPTRNIHFYCVCNGSIHHHGARSRGYHVTPRTANSIHQFCTT